MRDSEKLEEIIKLYVENGLQPRNFNYVDFENIVKDYNSNINKNFKIKNSEKNNLMIYARVKRCFHKYLKNQDNKIEISNLNEDNKIALDVLTTLSTVKAPDNASVETDGQNVSSLNSCVLDSLISLCESTEVSGMITNEFPMEPENLVEFLEDEMENGSKTSRCDQKGPTIEAHKNVECGKEYSDSKSCCTENIEHILTTFVEQLKAMFDQFLLKFNVDCNNLEKLISYTCNKINASYVSEMNASSEQCIKTNDESANKNLENDNETNLRKMECGNSGDSLIVDNKLEISKTNVLNKYVQTMIENTNNLNDSNDCVSDDNKLNITEHNVSNQNLSTVIGDTIFNEKENDNETNLQKMECGRSESTKNILNEDNGPVCLFDFNNLNCTNQDIKPVNVSFNEKTANIANSSNLTLGPFEISDKSLYLDVYRKTTNPKKKLNKDVIRLKRVATKRTRKFKISILDSKFQVDPGLIFQAENYDKLKLTKNKFVIDVIRQEYLKINNSCIISFYSTKKLLSGLLLYGYCKFRDCCEYRFKLSNDGNVTVNRSRLIVHAKGEK